MRKSGKKPIAPIRQGKSLVLFANLTEPCIYTHKGLSLDTYRWIMKYKGNPHIEVNPESKPIQLLLYLFKKYDQVVKYETLAEAIEINSYNPSSLSPDGKLDKLTMDAMKEVKRNLIKYFINAGMSHKDASNFILSKRELGYVIPK